MANNTAVQSDSGSNFGIPAEKEEDEPTIASNVSESGFGISDSEEKDGEKVKEEEKA